MIQTFFQESLGKKKKNMKKLLICIVILCLAFGLVACDGLRVDPREDGVVTIVTTSFAAYDFARQLTVGAPEGSVDLILLGKTGQDMHDFEPSAADITTIGRADLLVAVGNEAWLDAAVKSAQNSALVRVDMMTACETLVESGHDCDHDHEENDATPLNAADEHVWLSTENAEHIVAAMGAALVSIDAANAPLWETNLATYTARLQALTADFAAMRAGAVRDTLVIADRYPFAYLVHQLDLHCYAAFPGCSSETSASFETQTMLIEKTRELGLPYIFVIEGSDGKVAGVVAAESGAEILTLDSVQVVTDREKTYIGIMRKNLEELKKALY